MNTLIFDNIRETIQIQKFGRSTLLCDISADIRKNFNLKGVSVYNKVGDLPFQIWRCRIGIGRNKPWYYGKTLEEAFIKAKGITQQEALDGTRRSS